MCLVRLELDWICFNALRTARFSSAGQPADRYELWKLFLVRRICVCFEGAAVAKSTAEGSLALDLGDVT